MVYGLKHGQSSKIASPSKASDRKQVWSHSHHINRATPSSCAAEIMAKGETRGPSFSEIESADLGHSYSLN